MENNRYTPQIIAENKFAIPVYQRLFAWREKEVFKLLSDMKAHFDKSLSPYYIGMMTVISNNRGRYDLVDGQQRFTVMMLIAYVLRNYANCWDTFLRCDNSCRLEFTARSADNDYMDSLTKNNSCDYINKEMANAIACIQNFCKIPEENADENERGKCSFQNTEQVRLFAKNVYNYLTFFLAELPLAYMDRPNSLNEYFEVMNSAGKRLEQHEILMVNLLQQGQSNQKHRFASIWNKVSQMDQPISEKELGSKEYAEKYINKIEEYRNGNYKDISEEESVNSNKPVQSIENIEPKQKKPSSVYANRESGLLTFPEFLLLVLDLTLEKRNPKPEKFSEFQFYQEDKLLRKFEEFKINDDEVETFFHRMWFVRHLLDCYVIRRDFDGGQGHYTLIYQATDEEEKEELRRLLQYQSMLFVSTDFYRWLKPFVKFLISTQRPTATMMLSELKRIDYNIHKELPSIDNLKFGKVDRYWFWRLDYCLWDKRNDLFKEEYPKIVNKYVFRENRSIEHLHPQNQEKNDKWEENDINSFGNLAMISQSFNSQQGNENVRVKFSRIENQVQDKTLQSIKLLKMYLSVKGNPEGWTQDAAKKHGAEMWNILNESVSETTKLFSTSIK